MAYLKPPWFPRKVFNPLASRFGIGHAEKLTVAGRTSGQPRSVPVVSVDVGGSRHLVSARGETEWVRNVRKAGRVELARRGSPQQRFATTQVPAQDSTPIIAAYRQKAGRAVAPLWKKLPDNADHPTFRLTPTS
jgi:deazaflavin-dependent oxidoreductase (nitroreductase family)